MLFLELCLGALSWKNTGKAHGYWTLPGSRYVSGASTRTGSRSVSFPSCRAGWSRAQTFPQVWRQSGVCPCYCHMGHCCCSVWVLSQMQKAKCIKQPYLENLSWNLSQESWWPSQICKPCQKDQAPHSKNINMALPHVTRNAVQLQNTKSRFCFSESFVPATHLPIPLPSSTCTHTSFRWSW